MLESRGLEGSSLWVEVSGDGERSKPKEVVLFMELA